MYLLILTTCIKWCQIYVCAPRETFCNQNIDILKHVGRFLTLNTTKQSNWRSKNFTYPYYICFVLLVLPTLLLKLFLCNVHNRKLAMQNCLFEWKKISQKYYHAWSFAMCFTESDKTEILKALLEIIIIKACAMQLVQLGTSVIHFGNS